MWHTGAVAPELTPRILVELDHRKRASLARLEPAYERYLASVDAAGIITMWPVTLVSAVPGEHPAMLATPEPPAPVDTGGPELDELLHAAGLRDEHGGKVRNR